MASNPYPHIANVCYPSSTISNTATSWFKKKRTGGYAGQILSTCYSQPNTQHVSGWPVYYNPYAQNYSRDERTINTAVNSPGLLISVSPPPLTFQPGQPLGPGHEGMSACSASYTHTPHVPEPNYNVGLSPGGTGQVVPSVSFSTGPLSKPTCLEYQCLATQRPISQQPQ